MENVIKVRGARQHNLKNVNLDIPKNKLVVFTGVSGSGKSSLAFDTIYAEGQRRYVESLSTYARQFLGIMEKPDCDLIEGLSPAISIDQKTTSRNPRSTVGTVTEIYDYLRLLFARIGHPHCPICGREIASQSLDQIVDSSIDLLKQILKTKKAGRFLILAPLVNDKKGEFSSLFDNLSAKGFRQVRVDKHIRGLSEDFYLIKTNKHTIEVVVDKLSISQKELKNEIARGNLKKRLSDSLEQALALTEGMVIVSEIKDRGFEIPEFPKNFEDHLYSERFACPVDNVQLPEIEPRSFSFNSPHGACPTCTGLGRIMKVNPKAVLSNELTIAEGGILPFGTMFEHDTWYSRLVLTVCRQEGVNTTVPIGKLPESARKILLHGVKGKIYRVEGTNRSGGWTHINEPFRGAVGDVERRYAETESEFIRYELGKYMKETTCPECSGARLKKEALAITVDKKSIAEASSYSIAAALDWVTSLLYSNEVSEREGEIGKLIIKEIEARLGFLKSVGLDYLTINRAANTLSGGEAQRIRLASQIGSGLTGVLYVLDEPTIGLHQKDNDRLINTLKRLRDLGNTVLVVEHDRDMINSSDYVVDFGLGAGKNGGEVVCQGVVNQIKKTRKSLTGAFLSGRRKIDVGRWKADGEDGRLKTEVGLQTSINLFGCSRYNLKNIDIKIPLGKLVVITGVSGSGKSTLLVETLYPILQTHLNPLFKGETPEHKRIEGIEAIDKAILIDQSPIGRTPRSNPATYTKVFDPIRDVFASTREAKSMGFKKGRFSFNVKGGRCESCEGQGQIKIEMQFMSDIWVTCEVCHGSRYNAQTLEVVYKGKSIADVLKMTVSEAKEFFHNHAKIVAKLDTLEAVGLDYMELGQPATTLSGGEAQRVKLATELSRRDTGATVYILDEPTTGLHFADLERLLKVLKLLVARGNTVLLIEHNMDVIKNADWIIDLGPEGGNEGGYVVAEGTLSDIKKVDDSYTGNYLKKSQPKLSR
ncbi:excinuclease ABC subunit UvrA [Candidatus Woesebacteria bacterium]|nr:excinuclease ABC subunit UvrA [Candidatus Woesebacteria bacterium]